MLNFTHKACCPDGENALKIAQKIKKQTEKNINQLDFLISKRLDTKDFERVDIESVYDFPRIKRKKIRNSIFFGSFQLKQSKSYIRELIMNGIAFKGTMQFFKKLQNNELKKKLMDDKYKMIAVEIASRHKRSEVKMKNGDDNKKLKLSHKFKTTYKVFVLYESLNNHSSGIKGILN
jgi:hypothetical protein